MKEIKLTKGQVALVDDEDYESVAKYKWQASLSCTGRTWYASRTVTMSGKRTMIRLHQVILSAPSGFHVDHKNRNGLDCRRSNLRLATRCGNAANRSLRSDNTSGFKGVYRKHNPAFAGRKYCWAAQIRHNYKYSCIGYFKTAEEAARAYDVKAREFFGEFAWLNFPDIEAAKDGKS